MVNRWTLGSGASHESETVDVLILSNRADKFSHYVSLSVKTDSRIRSAYLEEKIEEVAARLARCSLLLVALDEEPMDTRTRSIVSLAEGMGIPIVTASPMARALRHNEILPSALLKHWVYVDSSSQEPLAGLWAVIRRHLPPSALTSWPSEIVTALILGNDRGRREALELVKGISQLELEGIIQELQQKIADATVSNGLFLKDKQAADDRAVVRSWLLTACIHADPERSSTRELARRHLKPEHEPSTHVRFWVLADLYKANASYLSEVLDNLELNEWAVPKMSALALAIQTEGSSKAPATLENFLRSPHREASEAILKALEIVPHPSMAVPLSEQLFRLDEAHDMRVVLAICHASVAAAVMPLLQKRNTVLSLVRAIAFTAHDSGYKAEHFIPPLRKLPRRDLVRSLKVLLEERLFGGTVGDLLGLVQKSGDAFETLQLAGFSSDTVEDQADDLGIAEDVKTLVAIMLATNVKPPLAIGLSGDWGSGKSFFMQAMYKEVERLSALSRPSFCAEVEQIRFNAWHYADSNLWASLVSCILESLAKRVSKDVNDGKKNALILEQLSCAAAIKEQAQADVDAAKKALEVEQIRLDQIREERHDKELRLQKLTSDELRVLLGNDASMKEAWQEASRQLGLPALFQRADELRDIVSRAHSLYGRTMGLLKSTLTQRYVSGYLLALAISLFAAPSVTAGLLKFTSSGNQWWTQACALVAQIGVAACIVIAWVKRGIASYEAKLQVLEEAKAKVDLLMVNRVNTPSTQENQLSTTIESLKEREAVARAQLLGTAQRVGELEVQLETLNASNTLSHFLAERSNSADYSRHLGLLSLIRRDFEELTRKLQDRKVNDIKHVDRIVLYIDDLDRCPADKVADVLQAVHLLLAYPLFVVVVGVDSRWLLHSLSKQYVQFDHSQSNSQDKKGLWATTPQHYLEKIFQISFTMRPMDQFGSQKLIGRLFGESSDSVVVANDRPAAQAGVGLRLQTQKPVFNDQVNSSSGTAATVAESEPQVARAFSADTVDDTEAVSAHVQTDGVSTSNNFENVVEEALLILPWETNYAKKLHRLIPSPRAAKRFSNVYRILKARVRASDLATYEGNPEALGTFRVPMLLLAILTYSPRLAAHWFPRLMKLASDGQSLLSKPESWHTQALYMDDSDGFDDLARRVREVMTSDFPSDVQLIEYWIPAVSRFSFDLGRHLASWEAGGDEMRVTPEADTQSAGQI